MTATAKERDQFLFACCFYIFVVMTSSIVFMVPQRLKLLWSMIRYDTSEYTTAHRENQSPYPLKICVGYHLPIAAQKGWAVVLRLCLYETIFTPSKKSFTLFPHSGRSRSGQSTFMNLCTEGADKSTQLEFVYIYGVFRTQVYHNRALCQFRSVHFRSSKQNNTGYHVE